MNALNLPQYLTLKVEQFAERIFLRDFDSPKHYTYRDLADVTDRLAGALQVLGVRTGERVALLHPNHSDFILGYFAIIKAGAVAVPINPVYTAQEVLFILQDCGACCLLATSDFKPLLQEIKDPVVHLKEIVITVDMGGVYLQFAIIIKYDPWLLEYRIPCPIPRKIIHKNAHDCDIRLKICCFFYISCVHVFSAFA